MSDLAAPLLFVMRDEAEAFWAFAALMDRCEANFHTDCTCVIHCWLPFVSCGKEGGVESRLGLCCPHEPFETNFHTNCTCVCFVPSLVPLFLSEGT